MLRERLAGEKSMNEDMTTSLNKARVALERTEQEKEGLELEQQRLRGRIAGPIAGTLKEWERSAATRFLRAPYAASPVPRSKSSAKIGAKGARNSSKAVNQQPRPSQTNSMSVSSGVQAVIGKRPSSLVTALWAGQKAHTWLVCYCCGNAIRTPFLDHYDTIFTPLGHHYIATMALL